MQQEVLGSANACACHVRKWLQVMIRKMSSRRELAAICRAKR
jgi:hypothetical protein